MRKWVKLNEKNVVIGCYESDIDQQNSLEIFTNSSIEDIVGKIYVDSNTLRLDVESEGLQWRNSELLETDWITGATDHPDYQKYIEYRQKLRDWPETADFPNIHPVLEV